MDNATRTFSPLRLVLQAEKQNFSVGGGIPHTNWNISASTESRPVCHRTCGVVFGRPSVAKDMPGAMLCFVFRIGRNDLAVVDFQNDIISRDVAVVMRHDDNGGRILFV